jgi:hypothetical protein
VLCELFGGDSRGGTDPAASARADPVSRGLRTTSDLVLSQTRRDHLIPALRDYGPTTTIFAVEGTPAPLTRNSMYVPGGAQLGGAVPVILVELAGEKSTGKFTWL